jgi:broad specificity phosphatase PhoE
MPKQTTTGWPDGLELDLIRHGHINWGRAAAGDEDFPLDELGVSQAIALGESWQGTLPPDVILTSPLSRAKNTMTLACQKAGWDMTKVQIIVVPEFAEQKYGVLAGLSDEEIFANYRSEFEKKLRQGWWFFQPPGGQSWKMLTKQQRPAFERIKKNFAGMRIKLFGHCVQIQCSRLMIEGMTPEKLLGIDLKLVTNCSETSYRSENGKMVLVRDPYYRPESLAKLG